MKKKVTKKVTKMSKTTDIAVLGALGIAGAVIFLNLKNIQDWFSKTGETASQVAGTIGGVTTGVVAIPYDIGQVIGGALGTMTGDLLNAVRSAIPYQPSQQQTQNRQTLATNVAAQQQTVASQVGALSPASTLYNQLTNLEVQFQQGGLSSDIYMAQRQGLITQLLQAGVTAASVSGNIPGTTSPIRLGSSQPANTNPATTNPPASSGVYSGGYSSPQQAAAAGIPATGPVGSNAYSWQSGRGAALAAGRSWP